MLSVYSITCMCVFRDDHLAVDNESMCFSFGGLTLPLPYLPVVPHVGLRPCELYPSTWYFIYGLLIF